jgi:hypothetical protein
MPKLFVTAALLAIAGVGAGLSVVADHRRFTAFLAY